ncbi:hypothetical protein O59_000215 [Cellvibrio sp. BR]|nr:hypothetical protein O59_000215 [Cellvibrio sp. BR]
MFLGTNFVAALSADFVRQSVRWVSYDDTFFILFSPCTASDGFLLNIQFAVCPDR